VARVEKLLGGMTLVEIIGQMSLIEPGMMGREKNL
jgi:hypothetical protein